MANALPVGTVNASRVGMADARRADTVPDPSG